VPSVTGNFSSRRRHGEFLITFDCQQSENFGASEQGKQNRRQLFSGKLRPISCSSSAELITSAPPALHWFAGSCEQRAKTSRRCKRKVNREAHD